MSEGQVARVYAGALLGAALDSSPSLRAVLFDPQVETSAKQRVVTALSEGADPLVGNTLRLLLDRGRQATIAGVCREYGQLAAEEARVVAVEVTSAVALPPEAEERLARRVEEATGKRPQFEKRIDETIIGGLVLRIGDVLIDGSVRSRLRQLRLGLLTAEVRGGDQ